jgi:hypothetical protein
LRSRAIRAARARRRSWASSFGVGVCSDMASTVGPTCESALGATWELAERGGPVSGRARRGPGLLRDHLGRAGAPARAS